MDKIAKALMRRERSRSRSKSRSRTPKRRSTHYNSRWNKIIANKKFRERSRSKNLERLRTNLKTKTSKIFPTTARGLFPTK